MLIFAGKTDISVSTYNRTDQYESDESRTATAVAILGFVSPRSQLKSLISADS